MSADGMSTAVAARFARLTATNSALFVCDLQEKFRNNIVKFPEICEVSRRVIAAASILKVPIIATEQYPKGLGHLVPELGLPSGTPVIEKTKFSMCVPDVDALLPPEVNKIVLLGIEAHVCVLSTARDLRNKGLEVHVVVDGTSSRAPTDRKYAFKQMEKMGCWLTTSECVILGLLGGSDHPDFKAVQKLIMTSAPDTELMCTSRRERP